MSSLRMKSLPMSEIPLKASLSKSQSQRPTLFKVSRSSSPANGDRPLSLNSRDKAQCWKVQQGVLPGLLHTVKPDNSLRIRCPFQNLLVQKLIEAFKSILYLSCKVANMIQVYQLQTLCNVHRQRKKPYYFSGIFSVLTIFLHNGCPAQQWILDSQHISKHSHCPHVSVETNWLILHHLRRCKLGRCCGNLYHLLWVKLRCQAKVNHLDLVALAGLTHDVLWLNDPSRNYMFLQFII